jgi:glycerol-3-phosphate O-acyltransferase
VLKLREAAARAAEQGVSLIFLPCHKSHIDYLVVSYILYSVGIALPHIAAGDNLNLPGIGTLLRYNGAFFIRRQWGDDKLYVSVMKEYIELLMAKGYNIEAFIEGTRSRTGKLLRPKFGILKSCLDAVYSGRVKDAILVPVSIGYDKVIETPSYVDELLGRPKEKESLGQLVNSGFNLLQVIVLISLNGEG